MSGHQEQYYASRLTSYGSRLLWNKEDVQHVTVERYGTEQPEGRRLVDVDRAPCAHDIEKPPVGAGEKLHPGTTAEWCPRRHPPTLEVEGPELVAAHPLLEPVGLLPVRRQREADRLVGAQRVELHRFGAEVHPRDAHDAAVLHRI